VLLNERQHAGTKSITFDGSGLPSGIYFYRLQTGQTTLVKKMMLMR
ncbi:MAG: T9SS type A sorting domain-containing protein, partial [Ignavibacteriales bacterium]|nr:T9SS type A sorting domain-containing protein [Ignavibacteriales bacterium]